MDSSKFDPWQLLRYALVGLGTTMANGNIPLTESDIDKAAGAIVALVSVAWGIYTRWNSKAVPLAIVEAQALPTKSSVTGKVTMDATGSGGD